MMEMKKLDDDEHDYGHGRSRRLVESNKQRSEIWRIRPVGRKDERLAKRQRGQPINWPKCHIN